MPKRMKKEETVIRAAGEKRRKAILDAAWALFLKKGYAAVSVDEIIRISGGSKSSLYKFFGSKEGVLKVIIESLADDMLREVNLPVASDQTPGQNLRRIGLYVLSQALSANAVNQYRLAVANVQPFPELSRLWYSSGPGKVFEGFSAYVEREARAGRLRVRDSRRAALFFLGMLMFKDNLAVSIGADPPSKAQMEEIVEEAVEVFLAAYGNPRKSNSA